MKRPASLQIAGAIFASLLFVIVIGFVEIGNLDRPAYETSQTHATADPSPNRPAVTPQEPLDCAQAELDFNARLEQSRSCEVDADCAVAQFGCPFGCTTAVRQSALDEMYAAEKTFQQACHRCVYLCSAPLFEWRPACVRQRCIVFDRTVDDLEEDTMELINEAS